MTATKAKAITRYGIRSSSIKSGFGPPVAVTNQLINLHSKQGNVLEARKLFDKMPLRNVFSWNAMISAYVKSRNLAEARALFDAAPVRDLVTFNTVLWGCVDARGHELDAIELFGEMHTARCEIGIDEFTLTTMLKLAAKMAWSAFGRQLHCYMTKTRSEIGDFALSSLVDMYSKCGYFGEACEVLRGCEVGSNSVLKNLMMAACCRGGEMGTASLMFWRGMEMNDVVSWNTLISGYVQNGREEEAVKLFKLMRESGAIWNEHSFASVLSACSGLRILRLGKEVHGRALRNWMCSNPFIQSAIVDLYCKCGNIKYAESVVLATGGLNPFATASMIVGYSAKGNMTKARQIFDLLEEKNSVVWTALFTGFARLQQCDAVFDLFSEFRAKEQLVPDAPILLAVLSACASQAAIVAGKEIHGFILRMGITMDIKMTSTMVDMYSKSGSITYAENLFHNIHEKDTVLYNVMLASYAHHGHDLKAIQQFEEMLKKGAAPNEVTFIALLSACRHRGLVDLGEKFFHYMTKDCNIQPDSNHYACMVDLYGRAHQIEKAAEILRSVPAGHQDAAVLGAFLTACRLNGDAELARDAEEKLLKLEGETGSRYVQLANIYAAEGNWSEMGRIRKKMREKEARRLAGSSWVFVDHGVHIFTCGDRSHPKAKDIYSVLACLAGRSYIISEIQY